MDLPALDSLLSAVQSYWLMLVGAGVLGVFAAHHFNSPTYVLARPAKADGESTPSDRKKAALARTKIEAPPILTTRRESYRRAQFKYIAVLEAVFILYVLSPDLFATIAELAQIKVIIPESERDRVIYGLFGLMGVYATFPGLSRWDKRIRQKLHQRAVIPEDVTRTATRMFKADYRPTAEIEQAALGIMAESLAQVDYGTTRDPLKLEWFRLSCVHAHLRKTLYSDEFRRHYRCLSPEAEDIAREFARRQRRLAELIDKEARITRPDGKPLTDGEEEAELGALDTLEADMLLGSRKNLRFKIDVLYYRVCLLHSMMFFATEKTANRIERRFRSIGYDVAVSAIPRIDWESIVKTLVTISAVIFGPSLIYYVVKVRLDIVAPEGSGITVPETFHQTLAWSLNILVLHMLCLFVAMWAKRWMARLRAQQGPRRLRSKVVENAAVFGLCYAVTYGLGVFLFYPDHAMRVFTLGIPWAVVPALTGLFVAKYIDRALADQPAAWWIKFREGIVMGLFAAVASFLFTPPTPLVIDIPDVLWLYVVYISSMQVLVGLGVGWIFPRSYRKRLKANEALVEEEATASPAPLAAAA